MKKTKKINLPKDRAEIEYSVLDGAVVSLIRQNCGCEWEIVWKKSGLVEEVVNNLLCEDHDPTIDDVGDIVEW